MKIKARQIVEKIFPKSMRFCPDILTQAEVFAPINIALIKYWGKRNIELNLPCNSSFSVILPKLGTRTKITILDKKANLPVIYLNQQKIADNSVFFQRIKNFLDLFSFDETIKIETFSNIPISAGLASSASGFAALVKTILAIYDKDRNIIERNQSILARLASGSAARSILSGEGFCQLNKGDCDEGLDCFADIFPHRLSGLCIGVLILSERVKSISSSVAMQISVETSPFYQTWLNLVELHLSQIKEAILRQDFNLFGQISEHNASAMHALALSSFPSFSYSITETFEIIKKIQFLRENKGLSVFFTQDAGANIKILYLKQDQEQILQYFPNLKVIEIFS